VCLLRLGGAPSGPWEIITLIDETPTAVTYLARREESEELVALKRYRIPLEPSDGARLDERRRTLLALDHAGISRIRDVGQAADGTPYLATSFLRGTPVVDFCRHHALSPATRRHIVTVAADALAFAHRSQVAHGAVRPAHLLVIGTADLPQPVLIDFALPGPPGEPADACALDLIALAGVAKLLED
jgi:serine/threonine protein kinase